MRLNVTVAVVALALAGSATAQTKSTPAKPAGSAAAPAAKTTVAPPPRTDANCLLVSNVFAQQSNDPAQKAHAANVLFYYFGRIDGHASEAQMKAELKQAGSAQFTPESASALMNSCVQNMQSRAQVLQSVSQQLQQGK